MTGRVDHALRARVFILMRGALAHRTVEAVIDTGFTGHVSVAADLVERLGLKAAASASARYADGSIRLVDLYPVEVEWIEGAAVVWATASAIDDVLIGTALLEGHVLEIDFGADRRVEVR